MPITITEMIHYLSSIKEDFGDLEIRFYDVDNDEQIWDCDINNLDVISHKDNPDVNYVAMSACSPSKFTEPSLRIV